MVNHKLKLLSLAVIVGFLVNGCVSFPAHSQSNFLVFSCMCSLFLVNVFSVTQAKSNSVIARLVLVIIGVSSVFLGFKELQGLRVFAKHGIYVDNANWDKADDLSEHWFNALEEVNKVAPSYLRSARLANMKFACASKTDDRSEAKRLLMSALEACDDSLARHPFYAVAIAIKADCLHELGDFASAAPWYDKLVETTVYRQNIFFPYEKQAKNLAAQAKQLGEAGNRNDAERLFVTASEILSKSSRRNRLRVVMVSSWVAIERMKLLMIENNAYLDSVMASEYDIFYRDFFHRLRRNKLLEKYKELFYKHSLIHAQYAENEIYEQEARIGV